MNLPSTHFRHESPQQPTITRVAGSADLRWDRWTFKAPPLAVEAPKIDFRELNPEIQNRLSTR
jgi:hypothetical protein